MMTNAETVLAVIYMLWVEACPSHFFFFFSVPVQSHPKAWSPETPLTSFLGFPVRIGSRCHREAEGVQEIRGKAEVASLLGKTR